MRRPCAFDPHDSVRPPGSDTRAALTLDRRAAMLGGCAGALALSAAPRVLAASADLSQTPLRDLAQQKGLRFGSAIGIESLAGQTGTYFDPDYRRLMAQECDIMVPENALKMYAVHASPTAYDFARADTLLSFGEAHQIAMRGHNLVWARDEYTPGWLKTYDFGPSPKVEATRLLTDYVGVVTGHYGERLTSWDVVNEAVNPTTGQIRSQVFTRILGPDALKIAYQAARASLPRTQLVYNDYMSWEAGNETHRQGVLTLLRWFRKNDVPVDALGVQSHLGTGFNLGDGQHQQWQAFIDEVVSMGYDLLITELDVSDQRVAGDIAARDAKTAQVTRDYLDFMLGYKQLKDILVWGLVDKYSWLQSFSPRPDGAPLRPTLYDAQYRPKPLRQAVAAALSAASPR